MQCDGSTETFFLFDLHRAVTTGHDKCAFVDTQRRPVKHQCRVNCVSTFYKYGRQLQMQMQMQMRMQMQM